MTPPAVPSAVSSEDVRAGNDSDSACGQCTHRHLTGIAPVRERGLGQPHDGDGARMDGMATPGERSIHIVTDNKPKVRAGLGQQGPGAGTRTSPCLVMGRHATGGQRAPPPCVVPATTQGNPGRLPQGTARRKARRQACGTRRRDEAQATRSWAGEGWRARAP